MGNDVYGSMQYHTAARTWFFSLSSCRLSSHFIFYPLLLLFILFCLFFHLLFFLLVATSKGNTKGIETSPEQSGRFYKDSHRWRSSRGIYKDSFSFTNFDATRTQLYILSQEWPRIKPYTRAASMPEYQADHSQLTIFFSSRTFISPWNRSFPPPPLPYSSHKHATRPITSVCIERGQHFCSFHFITILFTLILYWISKLHDLFLLFFCFPCTTLVFLYSTQS